MNMKSIKYMLMAACCVLFTACMDKDWDEPDYSNGAPFGNNELQETNVITIAQLKAKYPNIFASTDQNALITDDIQIKGRITGNDLGGNIYKEVTLQDATGAIIIAINERWTERIPRRRAGNSCQPERPLHRRLSQATRDWLSLQWQ
jgi:hypothetical protein